MNDLGMPERSQKCLIVARNSTDIRATLLHALEALGKEIVVFSDREQSSKTPEQDLIEFLNDNPFEYVLVVGGDGTLRLVTHALQMLKLASPVLLVPSGTANDFARTLGDFIAAHEELSSAMADRICADVARVTLANEHGDAGQPSGSGESSPRVAHFINMMVIGPGAENSMTISSDLKQVVGSAAYLKQLYHSMVDAGSFAVDVSAIKADDSTAVNQRYHCSAIFVANGRTCGGGYCVVPNADPSDGMLDVVIVKGITMWEKLKLAASFMSDQHLASESTEYFRVREIRLSFDAPQAVTLDGECIQTLHVTIKAEHQCQSMGVFQIDQRV
jgi:YegS/Rv2252/BmrU family lipid kinase